MSLATRTAPETACVARLRALQAVEEELTAIITAQRAVLELAQAQGIQDQIEDALVRITINVAARSLARYHLERLAATDVLLG